MEIDEAELVCMRRQLLELRKTVRNHSDYLDTVTSPLWKRIVWWFQGFYFRKVGRWYGKDWNMNGVWPDKS